MAKVKALTNGGSITNEHMTAEDMFEPDKLIQVFDRKKGYWLGTLKIGQSVEEVPEDEVIIEKPKEDINQLKLF